MRQPLFRLYFRGYYREHYTEVNRQVRCCIGIVIPGNIKNAIDDWREQYWPQGKDYKAVPKDNFHITCLFIGHLQEQQRIALEAGISQLVLPRMTLNINTFAHWQKPSIGYLGFQNPTLELMQVQQQIVRIAQDIEIESMDVSRRFVPHITLARKFKPNCKAPSQRPDILFEPEKIGLFESVSTPTGVHYPVRKSWSLG